MTAMSVRDMLEALIAGERDPHRLADLARGKMRSKHAALVPALTGRFDTHHGVIARMLLNQIDALNTEVAGLDERINEQLTAITVTQTECGSDDTVPILSTGVQAVQRLSEVTGIGVLTAQVIVSEIGIDMSRFPGRSGTVPSGDRLEFVGRSRVALPRSGRRALSRAH